MTLKAHLDRCPFIAILRGITPPEAADVGRALRDAGIAIVEVPLNSPSPLESIRILADTVGETMLVGSGTVLTTDAVDATVRHGGRLIVMPHADARVIRAAKLAGAVCTPGAVTPTECFAALEAGADGIKLFPAESVSPATLKAMRVVFPGSTVWIPVGGITPQSLTAYKAAGASGFGIGSAIYAPGTSAAGVARNARSFMEAWTACA